MVKLVDTLVLETSARKGMWVRLPPSAPGLDSVVLHAGTPYRKDSETLVKVPRQGQGLMVTRGFWKAEIPGSTPGFLTMDYSETVITPL